MRGLLAEGIDLRGYFHWTLADNFEWNEGWHLRFGLYELDPATQMRKPRPSAQVYKRLITEIRRNDLGAESFNSGTAEPTQKSHLHVQDTPAELTSGRVTKNESSLGK
jgi:hypothetical protein